METSTSIQKMLAGNRIFVPSYQRAYSWETEPNVTNSTKQVNVFLSDLEEYNKSKTSSKYYFGHFLFEEKESDEFGIIDGQQRLTTIVIFLSALFKRLESIRSLNEDEEVAKEDMILRKSTHRFETVEYDKQLFKDYVITQTKKDTNCLETGSAKRIVEAFNFFNEYLSDKDETYLGKMLDTISNASCTTHPVKDESEAIQMFIFQNNRGKKPSNLEIIKAQFMFNIHLFGGEEKDTLIEEIKNRFEKIYKSISSIEYNINEDDVLIYTLRVHFDSLWETNPIDRINKLLSEENCIEFIKKFTQSLATSFEYLTIFFGRDEKESIQIHSLVTLGGIGIVIPFIIKAYKFGLSREEINSLCDSLASVVLRHRLIGTRADITSRLNDVYKKFTKDSPNTQPIIDRILWMKETRDWWWAYWNNDALESAVQGNINRSTAKYLLWKYENYLRGQGKGGYTPMRFDNIESPELEHIAPQTPSNGELIEVGYPEYDEEFKNQFIDCLGNYLLLSKSHNCSIGNKPFSEKRESYNYLKQQLEIQEMTKESHNWTRELIQSRKEKIIKYLMENV
ncbi:DUF262 domain-containing protein [Capnocytophaga canimorsus]|uniref:DUF262 domain-containing protein n=1 Tax=Capnocytophaga canimorsus TaxID=28188 RepID=UPI0038585CF2